MASATPTPKISASTSSAPAARGANVGASQTVALQSATPAAGGTSPSTAPAAASSTAPSNTATASGATPAAAVSTAAAQSNVAAAKAAPERTYPWGRVWAAVGLNWVVPGSGWFLVGERARAWALVLLLNGVFLLGLGLKGAVIVPEFNFRSPTFNIINVLTFSVQVGAGGPSFLSLGARDMQAKGNDSAPVRFLAGKESAAVHDLGAFHLLLVGALNYFACCALYDRFRPRPAPNTRK